MYYKVIAFDEDNNLSSCTVDLPSWRVDYFINIPVKPVRKDSKLFVFNDLLLAKKWIENLERSRPLAIYECEVKNSETTLFRCRYLTHYNMCSFWEDYQTDKLNPGIVPQHHIQREVTPKGTCLVDTVTLTRLVEVFERNRQLYSDIVF